MQKINPQEILWHSRRGMLELDLLLVPFAEQAFGSLSPQEQSLYQDFLNNEDQDLYAWLISGSQTTNDNFKPLIDKILAHNE